MGAGAALLRDRHGSRGDAAEGALLLVFRCVESRVGSIWLRGPGLFEPDPKSSLSTSIWPCVRSGAGFLAPFHLGALKTLLDTGIINDRTKVGTCLFNLHRTKAHPSTPLPTHSQLAGASAGSLVAASTVLGLSPEEQLEAYMRMTHACRASGYVGRVYPVLARSLRERFPDNAHEICNGRLVNLSWIVGRLKGGHMTHFASPKPQTADWRI